VRIACEVSGAGPALVLVHGAGAGRWGFDLLRPHLDERFTVIALDRRGRGDSEDAPGYALEQELEDVAAVVRDAAGMGSTGVVLVGHSYGGLLAAGAAQTVDGLSCLVLYEPPMGGVLAEPAATERWERLIQRGERERMVTEFLGDVGGYSHDEIDALRETPLWEKRLAVASTVARELRAENAFRLDTARLADLRVPTLMMVGSESPAWARRSTEAYATAIPGATVRTLEGEGHGAALSAPQLVASEIVRFCSAQ